MSLPHSVLDLRSEYRQLELVVPSAKYFTSKLTRTYIAISCPKTNRGGEI